MKSVRKIKQPDTLTQTISKKAWNVLSALMIVGSTTLLVMSVSLSILVLYSTLEFVEYSSLMGMFILGSFGLAWGIGLKK